MKLRICFIALPLLFGISSMPAQAADACESVLCLYGKMTGNSGGGDCKSPEKAFFDIVKKSKGSIKWNKTFNARQSFLNQCSSADPTIVSKIMSKYGKVKL